MDIHAAIYGRQSSARENKSEVSTSTQIEAGIAEAEKWGAATVEIYEDLGISAFKTGIVRPEFERLLTDCRMGRRNLLIVYYVSRLSRMKPTDAIPVVIELLNLGVTLVSVTEGVFRRDNLPDLIHLIIRLDQAHNESKNKSDAIGGAKRKARQLGGYTGGVPPYGFQFRPETRYGDDGKPIVIQRLEPNPAEAAVIREAWKRIKTHKNRPYEPGKVHPGSMAGICVRFNNEKIPTRGQTDGKKRSDSRWRPETLKRILSDPRIAGFDATPIYATTADGNQTTKIAGYRIKRDDDMNPITICEPIIPPTEWLDLQDWIKTRGRGQGLNRRKTLLSGLRTPNNRPILTCECGKPMGSMRNGKQTNYRCTRPRGGVYPGQHSGGNTISQAYVNDYVARRIFALITTADDDPGTAEILAEATRRYGARIESSVTAQDRAQLVRERADVVRALEELYDDRQAGAYSSTIGQRKFRSAEATLSAKLDTLDARIRELDEAESPTLPLTEWLTDDPDADPLGPGSWWAGANLEAKRDFVTLFVDRIIIRKPNRGGKQTTDQIVRRISIEWARPKEE